MCVTLTVSLWLHICAGTIALLSGVIAMLTRKDHDHIGEQD
jgi:hypothetical protein